MKTGYEWDLYLRAVLMGDAAFIGKMFVPNKFISTGVYRNRTYKVVSFEGDVICIELVARDDNSTMFIGDRFIVNINDLKGRIQFVSPEFVRTYK